jgi:hypothetical protein
LKPRAGAAYGAALVALRSADSLGEADRRLRDIRPHLDDAARWTLLRFAQRELRAGKPQAQSEGAQ